MIMKQEYSIPEMEMIEFPNNDIVVTSNQVVEPEPDWWG